MNRLVTRASVLLGALVWATLPLAQTPMSTELADPYLWLEEVDGVRALDFARVASTRTLSELRERREFAQIRDEVREVLDSRDRIAQVVVHGEHLYNFWQDRANPRGLWRRTTWDEYRKPQPAWETVLDVDALARDEKENWVWKNAQCLPPRGERCLLSLSRGGGDAIVVREFDLGQKQFVADGFALAEAKSDVDWRDRDTIYVSTDFGAGSMTDSGYPRIVRRWSRGTPLAQAVTVFEGQRTDVGASAWVDHDVRDGITRITEGVRRSIAFYNGETFVLRDGAPVRLDVPNDAAAQIVGPWLVVRLRSAWNVGGRSYPVGALIVTSAHDFLSGRRAFEVLFEPTARTALQSWSATRNTIVLDVLDNVRSRLWVMTPGDGGWRSLEIALPSLGAANARAVDRFASDQVFITYQDFLTPPTLFIGVASEPVQALKSMPAFFDASRMAVQQLDVRSRDGTRVPYFVIGQRGVRNAPTMLYGYGGFENALEPFYSGALGRAWLARGGVLVIANIRGGGEFGPAWHQAALKEKRQNAFDDFIAIGEDLARRGIAQPKQIGIRGGSNGGLLVGAALTQRPELFGAAVAQVPLLDMKRYNKLLAGASWMAEYGDPDVPDQWAYIAKYSPYQNVRKDARYPPTLFVTSTRDDRVHPAHARKMFARMREQGHDAWYYENIEGGHGAASNNEQRALMAAIEYTFLWKHLGGKQ
ncbi:MAG TPA: prolyl oligopeptidase family serine peptidase [Burkholderiaceae bacterium]|nr:prolyl oligopeptidase family serine peptidase [Burkholderiaceae bacterium]